MLFSIIFLLPVFYVSAGCCKCCECCCCCCKARRLRGGGGVFKSRRSVNIPKNYIDYDDVLKHISVGLDKNYVKKSVDDWNKSLDEVDELLTTKLRYEYLPNEPKFPHLHWNGSIVSNNFKLLCFMLAPLNILFHLDCIIDFFGSDKTPKDSDITDNGSLYNYLAQKHNFNVFKLYIDSLLKGESFTLDPGDGPDSGELLCKMGLYGKVNNCTSDGVVWAFINLLWNFDYQCISYVDMFDHSNDFTVDLTFWIDKRLKDNEYPVEANDVIFFHFFQGCAYKDPHELKTKSINFKNIPFQIVHKGCNYVLKGLEYFDTNGTNIRDGSNDCLSFIYDKKAPDSTKHFVYCQLNKPLKYYSLQNVEEWMVNDCTEISTYKHHHLYYLCYEKVK